MLNPRIIRANRIPSSNVASAEWDQALAVNQMSLCTRKFDSLTLHQASLSQQAEEEVLKTFQSQFESEEKHHAVMAE